ncbi:MAG: NADH-quinone oxidoreductase subunit NuoE [Phycisphaerae bacterium]|nr:NADH-quinone oxidoreductase subunit NuoE [Phycisphaerae bacterium]
MDAVETDVGVDFGPAAKILQEMGRPGAGDLIPLLQRLQQAYGYLPREVLVEVVQWTGIPLSRMYEVATFYEQFHLLPRGRHTIRLCRGTACHIRGVGEILKTLERLLKVKEGETTEDLRFTLETVACLGTCFLAPVMMIDEEYFGDLVPTKVARILKKFA